MTIPQTGTEERHICSECGHAEQQHGTTTTRGGAARCCFGWCRCDLGGAAVRAANPAELRPVFAGHDAATDKWAVKP